MEPVILSTPRLVLRPFEPSDTDAVFAACQDPDVPRWTNVPAPYTRDHAQNFVNQLCPDGWRDNTSYSFAVVTKGNGVLVGAMGLVRLELGAPERQAELGYWTVKERRGRGYTAEAARHLADWAFRDLGVERLEWYAEVGNDGSWAVARSVGFQLEGTLRARIPYEGTRRDALIAALLPTDLGHPTPTPYLPGPQTS
ncbi:GNAT family N-acetyltransferase [Streptomyces zagrosensis]|uniref:RimJ/RimL family protein N-acetyltransferase n=1 Tax=Streptomyces zagrosensis TaxID=1042984 RepID=A0A7W9UXW6_9ACTN|nr:GNAT family protein [Streptomyces zagrosensis]MBB5935295.1 RimJ/RimL family protein N-acetyltransferase [Streptomyces zagrosensis]